MGIDKKYLDPFILATERAAYGAFLFKGKGDKIAADQSAVDEMRNQLNKINMKGSIVIGEGELDQAPMLYIGEKVGNKSGEELDIAVDPLEGTNFTAKNLPNALSVLAVTKKGNLLHAPDIYMEKIAIGAGFPDNLVENKISIEKLMQIPDKKKRTASINIITHKTLEKRIINCLRKLKKNKHIIKSPTFIRVGDINGN